MKHSTAGPAGFFAPVLNFLLLILVSLSLTGASVWEGAAALAPRGDLPEEGYYAATNSFPPNTVVDITNLETGRSIRAIVSSGLNTPGLLAVLSPDAAGRIGLGTRTIGRIRMTQPEDPIAFARFTEGLVGSGDPDYDPAAMLAVEQDTAKTPEEPPARQEAETNPGQDPAAYSYNPPGTVRYPDYTDYSQNSIVSVTRGAEIPQERIDGNWEEDWDDISYSGYFPDDEDSPERSSYLVWEQGGSIGKPENRGSDPAPEHNETLAESAPSADPWENAWREDGPGRSPSLVAELQSSAKSSENESIAEARILIRPSGQVAQAPVQSASDAVEYILVPAEKRPPAPGPEEAMADLVDPPAAALERIDESMFIDSIEKIRGARAAEEAAKAAEAARLAGERRAAEEAIRVAEERKTAEAARLAEERRAAEEVIRLAEERKAAEAAQRAEERRAAEAARLAGEQRAAEEAVRVAEERKTAEEAIRAAEAALLAEAMERPQVTVILPKEEEEPGGPWTAELPPSPPEPPPSSPEAFSVPVNIITELEKGKYYVQLGAFRSVTSVESALLGIDPGYPLNVQNSGSAERPVYRILVGPVNQGESGALVQRFKGSGYRDAYIRTN
ncbi:MAG: hypothetical protein LBI94_00765 [Treponema sp.]|jgi:hypothetical protein|nr:hypothetical protein [Treponema sp.]